jgi:hypothetical protein
MNDPVTNVAIEDVLSSIRRLVSEDARVRPVAARIDDSPAEDRPTPVPVTDMPGKLVLTPALRVADTDADSVPEQAEEAGADLAHDAVADAMAEDQDMPIAGDVHAHPPVSDDLADRDVAFTDAAPTDEPDMAQADEDGISIKDIASDATLASISEALAWEDHHADDAPDALPGAGRDDADDAATLETSETFDAEGMIPDTDPPHDGAGEGAFVFATSRDNGTPDQDSVTAFAAGDYDRSGADLDGSDSLFADDDTILDEEMLRELVTDIVRQELQGALGERITRNVRKLVRREIHRALASHDLE